MEPNEAGSPPPLDDGPDAGSGSPPPPPDLPPALGNLDASVATPNERGWAIAAHLAALVGLTGLLSDVSGALHVPSTAALGPLVVWLIKRSSSRYVSYHALQCLTLQLAALAVMIALRVLKAYDLIGLVNVAAIGYAVYGGIEVGNRHNFSYYIVGPWVRAMTRPGGGKQAS